ncbi:MAG: hypothetical protein J6J43_02835 [Oscillospiraceae bacterium]|nr:hypothetical protein [Oscillospiraceae bacterium]
MYDIYAPIIPRVGMGGFLLNMSKQEAEKVLGYPLGDGENMHNGAWKKYMIDDALTLFFSVQQNKLKAIETEKDYKGLVLGRIGTSTDEADLLRLDPTLVYDEFEEVYESKEHHYQIETCLPEEKARWISISTEDWSESRMIDQ